MLAHEGEFADFFAETRKPGNGFARVWKITLANGTIIRLTDHDRDVTVPGASGGSPGDDETFEAMAGFDATAMRHSIGAQVDNLNAQGITSTEIAESDLIRGLFDDAEVRIGVVCWSAPSAGVWWNFRGYAGPIKTADSTFDVEWRALTDYMTRPHGRAFLGECDVLEFGDARCGLDLAALGFVQTGAVSATSSSDRIFTVDVVQADGYFQFGKIEFLSGGNVDWSAEIVSHASNIVSLIQKPPYAVAVGNQVRLTRGCNRTWDTCQGTFDNLVNFRGFGARKGTTLYFMPPDEILAETPDAQ